MDWDWILVFRDFKFEVQDRMPRVRVRGLDVVPVRVFLSKL